MPLAFLAVASAIDKGKFKIILIDGRIEIGPHDKTLNLIDKAI